MMALEVKNLVGGYSQIPVLTQVSLAVQPGELVGLIGLNGAGKSTTFRMLCGLSRPTEGECFVAGMNLLTAAGAAR